MKKKVYIIIIFVLVLFTGCHGEDAYQMDDNNFISIEDVSNLYFKNSELFNRIKNGLLSSDFIPHDGMIDGRFNSNFENHIFLKFDYENNYVFCCNDCPCENLINIQNIHIDIVDYFMLVYEAYNPSIFFRKVRDIGIVIEFSFFDRNTGIHKGLVYSANATRLLGGGLHLEDYWYVYSYIL